MKRHCRALALAAALALSGGPGTGPSGTAFAQTPPAAAPGSAPAAAPPAAATGTAPPAATATRPTADRLADVRASLLRRAEADFALREAPPVDAELLAAARSMLADHLARLDALFASWIAEEVARGPAADAEAPLDLRVFARYVNELVLWQLDSAGAAHDDALLAAITSYPQLCRAGQGLSWFALVVRRWQGVPAAQRAAFLDGERELLRRWGRAERQLPPRPPAGDARALELALGELRDGRTPQRWPAMPPVLAHAVFAEGAEPLRHVEERCLLQQWWLRARLQVPGVAAAERAAALAAFRWRQMWRIEHLTNLPGPAIGPDGYPTHGRRFVVTGTTSMRVSIGADGRATRAEVLAQRLGAPGIAGAPLAFEPLFDEAAIARAMAHAWGAAPAGSAAERVVTVDFVWKLQ